VLVHALRGQTRKTMPSGVRNVRFWRKADIGRMTASDPKRTLPTAPKFQNLTCVCLANSALSASLMIPLSAMSAPIYKQSGE
jgi:hypothetical protein